MTRKAVSFGSSVSSSMRRTSGSLITTMVHPFVEAPNLFSAANPVEKILSESGLPTNCWSAQGFEAAPTTRPICRRPADADGGQHVSSPSATVGCRNQSPCGRRRRWSCRNGRPASHVGRSHHSRAPAIGETSEAVVELRDVTTFDASGSRESWFRCRWSTGAGLLLDRLFASSTSRRRAITCRRRDRFARGKRVRGREHSPRGGVGGPECDEPGPRVGLNNSPRGKPLSR